MICDDDGTGKCKRCGTPLPNRLLRNCGRRSGKVTVIDASQATLRDTAIRDGTPFEVLMLRKPCARMGEKKLYRDGTPLTTKQCGCGNTSPDQPVILTPVYTCSEFRLCAPFARKIDDEESPVHPCIGCTSYQRPLA